MKKSIKTNLIIKLSSLIAITLTATYIAAYVSVRNEINLVLDADLAKSSKLILGVVSHDGFVHSASNLESELSQKVFNKFEYKIHIQAWKGSRMVYNSGEKLDVAKPDYSGFKDVWLQDKWWRSFAINDQVSDITVLVLEKSALRNHLISEILVTLLIPLIICFAPLFLIIISAVKSELSPLKSVAKSIEEISTKTLKKYRSPSVPVEMTPFVDSFNSLLARLDQSMESERRFSDYAAHELNTPLAAIKLQAQIIANKKLKISVQKNDVPNLVRANKIYIQIMIENLLENAFKYSFDESEINIKIECGIVEIVNRGKQISAEEVAKIFDNFYRAKNSQDQVGSGLGLAIARKIANLHGGEIYFSSNAEKTVVSADLNGAICRRIIH